MKEQLGFDGLGSVEKVPVTQVHFAQKLRRYGELLALGFDPETGGIVDSNTEAAFLAGMSDTRDRAKRMAYKYKDHKLVLQAMEEMKRQQRGHYAMKSAEYLGLLRETFDQFTGRAAVDMPVFDKFGNPKVCPTTGAALMRPMRYVKPEAAVKLLEQMGKVTGLLSPAPDDGKDKDERVVVSSVPKRSDEDWQQEYSDE